VNAKPWVLDPETSNLLFAVKHLMISKVHGSFKRFSGTLQWNPEDPTLSSAEAKIEVGSIDTRDRRRDEHLTGDFFDPTRFPLIEFHSTRFQPIGGSRFEVTGELQMHGMKRSVQLKVNGLKEVIEDQRGQARMKAIAETTLNRKDFGLEWNAAIEAGGLTVGEEIAIRLELTWIRA
jgi:hypothetical protein